jgi:hypothetical protein
MSQYIISPVTLWDSEKELWETHIIHIKDKKRRFVYSAWGRTEEESSSRAYILQVLLDSSNGVNHS